MGMFKWLKRELRSSKKEQSKSSLGFEHVESPTKICNGIVTDETRDEDYLRKLSKFNEWRSSHVSLRQDQLIEDKRHNDRRMSQADFRNSSDPRKDVRYSLDNHHLQYRNDAKNSTPRNSKNIENYYITDKSQTEPKSYYQNNYKDNNIKNGNTNMPVKRELARMDMTFNRKSIHNASQKHSRKDQNNYNSNDSLNKNLFNSPKKWLLEGDSECIQNSFNELSPRSESPPELFYHENSLPFCKGEETYQWVVNKHGEVVEYALPYNERSIDAGKRNLSDIIENDSNSEGRSDSGRAMSANSTYSIAHSLNLECPGEVENQCSNVRNQTPDQGLGMTNSGTYKIARRFSKEMEDPLVSRCGTNVSNDKVAKRLSELDLKIVNKTFEKKANLQEKEFLTDGNNSAEMDSSHNQEFLDAIEDLVNLGRWSRRQLESEEINADVSTKNQINVETNDKATVKLSMLQPINPFSELLSCPVVHINTLSISDETLFSSLDNILEWRNAEWCQQDVCVRSPKHEMIHLHRTQTALARDVHILRNVPHRSIALLMAIAYDDNNQIITVMEPFSITLNQLLHSQPFEITLQLSTCYKFIQQICSALTFLHARGFIHSNISSHCILINQYQTEAKLAGFDLAVSVDKAYKKSYNERKQFEYDHDDNIQSSNSSNGDLSNNTFLRRHNSSNKEIRKRYKDPKKIKSYTVWDTCVWGEEQLVSDRTVLGHYQWQAPELFQEENSRVRPCTGSDVYSLTLVLLECSTESIPWKDISSKEIAKKYDNNICIEIPEGLEIHYKQLIKKGSELNPNLRNLTPADLMMELNSAKDQNYTSNTFVWKNEKYGSHSRLLNVIKNYHNEEKYSADELIPKKTLNTAKRFETSTSPQKKDNSGNEKYYTELNSDKVEFSLDDTKRMTASDFIRQLEIETTNLTRMLEASTNIKRTPDKKFNTSGNSYEYNTPYNIFNSPLDASNATEYYSLAEKSNTKNMANQNTHKTLTNTTISPIIDSTQSGKLLLNVTPRFYTPLQIQTPVTTPKDLPINNSAETGKVHDSTYSFDIEDYELPETPIARNTKIRKNAWLSEQKQKLDIDKEHKQMSMSFGGYQCDNEYNEQNVDSTEKCKGTISADIQNQETPIQKKDNLMVQEIQSDPIPLQRDQKFRRNIRIHNVKSKLNDILAKGLNCGTNCITSTPTRTSPFSSSYSLDRKYTNKEKVLFSPVKPASHSIEPKLTYLNQKQGISPGRLSPPYRPENIKPASHQAEYVAIPHKEQEELNKPSAAIEESESIEEIQPMNKADFFENSLWKPEKNKCQHNNGSKVTITSSYIDYNHVEEMNCDNFNKSFNSDIISEKRLLPVSVHFTTLPRRVSTKFIIRPENKFFTQACRKESVATKKMNVLEIAKLFEKRNSFVINSNNDKSVVDCTDSCVSESKIDNNTKSANSNKLNNDEVATPVKNRLDQSFIYNNALNESETVEEKVCAHCGSHMKEENDQKQERRLTLGPEIAEICANILRSSDSLWQVSDIDSRYLLGAFEFAQSPLKRCQAFPAIQNARSTEDLYIDDEFSAEHLGSHMQLSETRNDIFYREGDVYSINLSDNPLSINLTEINDDDCVEEPIQKTECSLSNIEEETETSL